MRECCCYVANANAAHWLLMGQAQWSEAIHCDLTYPQLPGATVLVFGETNREQRSLRVKHEIISLWFASSGYSFPLDLAAGLIYRPLMATGCLREKTSSSSRERLRSEMVTGADNPSRWLLRLRLERNPDLSSGMMSRRRRGWNRELNRWPGHLSVPTRNNPGNVFAPEQPCWLCS